MNILQILFPEKRVEGARERYVKAANKTLVTINGGSFETMEMAIKEFKDSLGKLKNE